MTTVQVEGLKALNKALKEAGEGAEKDLRRELKIAGVLVRDEAKRIAQANGLNDTGALIRGIKVGYRRTSVTIYETASRDSSVAVKKRVRNRKGFRGSVWVQAGSDRRNYPYPIIYEFGGRSSGHRFSTTAKVNNRSAIGKSLASYSGPRAHSQSHLGPRAFMYPALERKADEVLQLVGGVVDKFVKGD